MYLNTIRPFIRAKISRGFMRENVVYKRFIATQSKHKMALSDSTVSGTVVESHTESAAGKNKIKK